MIGPIGLTEILVISGVVLLVFGPKRLPELAKGMGKGIRDFKKALEGGGGGDDKKNLPSKPADENTIDVSSNESTESTS